MILAIDAALKTGWCLMKDGRVYESGVMDFSRTRGESNGAMFLRFRMWLNELFAPPVVTDGEGSIHVHPVTVELVVYEQAHHRGGPATEIAVGLTTRVQEEAEAHNIPFVTVHTATLKKFATGKGNADKAEMILQAKTILGRDPVDDNEADAVHLATWAFHNYGVS